MRVGMNGKVLTRGVVWSNEGWHEWQSAYKRSGLIQWGLAWVAKCLQEEWSDPMRVGMSGFIRGRVLYMSTNYPTIYILIVIYTCDFKQINRKIKFISNKSLATTQNKGKWITTNFIDRRLSCMWSYASQSYILNLLYVIYAHQN
jgi:hypothetical protein